MPKFTMKDVDKQIEEIRQRNRKPQVGQRPNVLQRLLDRAKTTKGKV